MRRVHVVAGILANGEDEILIADRSRSRSMKDHWEFPGGKLDDGESPELALQRELREELGIEVVSARHFSYVEHDYTDLNVAIDFFLVDEWDGKPSGIEGQQIRWVDRSTLHDQHMLAADLPIVRKLANS